MSRRVYTKSSLIFYQRNAFTFTETPSRLSSPSAVAACLAFFYDPPHRMLQYIQDIYLKVGRSPFDAVWKHIDYGIWNNLCEELSRYVNLERLTLHIEDDFCDIVGEDSCDDWKFVSAWGEGLFQISGLWHLEIETSNDHTFKENMLLVNYLRAWTMEDGVLLTSVSAVLKRKAYENTEERRRYDVFAFKRQS